MTETYHIQDENGDWQPIAGELIWSNAGEHGHAINAVVIRVGGAFVGATTLGGNPHSLFNAKRYATRSPAREHAMRRWRSRV